MKTELYSQDIYSVARLLMCRAAFYTIVLTGASALGQTPPASSTAGGMVSETRFNDSTGLLLREGAAIGPDSSGVSGQAGDKAYTADIKNSPHALAIPAGPDPLSDLQEITVTAWYKPRTAEMKDAQNLFNGFGSALLWDGKINEWMWRVGSKGTSNPQASTWYASGMTPQPITPAEWTFIGVTWKRIENRADYYMGSITAPAAFTRKVQRDEPIDPAKEAPKRAIGNDPMKPERAFDGEIDNVRFFTKALDAATMEKIRAADVKNETVSIP